MLQIIPVAARARLASFEGSQVQIQKKTKKKTVYISNPQTPLFAEFIVEKTHNGLLVKGAATVNNKKYPFTLQPLPQDFDETAFFLSTEESINARQKPEPKPAPVLEVLPPQKLWQAAELLGSYQGGLDNETYIAVIKDLQNEMFSIDFMITKRNGAIVTNKLWVKPHEVLLQPDFGRLYPQTIIEHKATFYPGQTTFAGQRFSEKNKSKRGPKPLCFKGALFLKETEAGKVKLVSDTTKGELLLTKFSDDFFEIDYARAIPDDARPRQVIEPARVTPRRLRDEPPAPEIPAEPPRRPREKRTQEKVYFDFDPYPNKSQKDQEERHRKEELELVKSVYDDAAEEMPTKISKKESPSPKKHEVLEHDGERPQRLNRYSRYSDNPLYRGEDAGANLWFGQAWTSNYGEDFHRDDSDRIVIGFSNLNGYSFFSENAAWCSYYSKKKGEANFFSGINAHCSVHTHGDKVYINISRHGLFVVKDDGNHNYELHKVQDSGSLKRTIYKMKPIRENHHYDTDQLADPACKYIGFNPDSSLRQNERRILNNSLVLRRALKKSSYLDRRLSLALVYLLNLVAISVSYF